MNQLFVNFIYSLKNAAIFKKEVLYFFYNKNFILLAKLFYKIGLIQDFKLITVNETRKIVVTLKHYIFFKNVFMVLILFKIFLWS
jgi:ribosomal protein S8